MQEDVVADRDEIGHAAAEAVGIAALEQHAVVAAAAVETIGQGLQALLAVAQQRGAIRNDLEGVIAFAAEQQVFGLPVEAAGEHVVAVAAEDPVLACPALQRVVAGAAQDHVAALDHRLVGEIERRRIGRRAQVDGEVVGGGNLLRRIDPQQVIAGGEAGKRHHAVLFAREVERLGALVAHVGRIGRVGGADLRDQRVARRRASRRHAYVIVPRREILERDLQPEHARRRRVGELDAGRIEQFELDRVAFAGLDQADAIVDRAHRGERELEHVDVGRLIQGEPDDLRQALDEWQHVGRGHRVVRTVGVGRVLRHLQHARTADGCARRGVERQPEAVEVGSTGELDAGARQCRCRERELEPVRVVRVVDREPLDVEVRCQRRVGQRTRAIARVVALVAIGTVDQDRITGIDGDLVIACAGIDPHGLLHGRPYRDRVVAALGIDQDDIVVALAGQHLVGEVGVAEIEILEREIAIVRIRRDRGRLRRDRVEVEQRLGGVPHRLAVGILAIGVQTDLGGETEVAVVVGEARDQVVVVEQSGLGHVVDRDDVVGTGGADVPDLAVLLGVILPLLAEQPAVERIEVAAVDAEVLVVAAVAVQEADAGTAVEFVVATRSEHAIETRVLERVRGPGRIAVEEAVVIGVAVVVEQVALAVGEHAELAAGLRIARPRVETVAANAADQIVVALTAEQKVDVRGRAVAAVAPEPVVAAHAVDHVAAAAAVEPVAAVAADQQVVARAAVEHADEIVGTGDERRQVDGEHRAVGLVDVAERDVVVAAQALDPELFDQRRLRRVGGAPHCGDVAGREARRDRILADVLDVEPAIRGLAQRDRVVVVGALDDQDVGGVVVGDIVLQFVAEVTVEGLVDACRQGVISRVDVEHEVVDAAAAIERVDTVLAFQPVAVGTTPKLIVAAAAVELILPTAAEQLVVGADHVGERAEAEQGAVEDVAAQVVVAAVAEQGVAAQVAVELVVARAAVQLVADQLPFGCNRGRTIDDAHCRVSEQRVDAIAAVEALASLLAFHRVGVAAEPGVALPSRLAVEEVGPGVAVELIDAGTAEERVRIVAAADDVVTGIAVDQVGILPTVDVVGIAAAVQHVLVAAAEDEIDAGAAVDAVLAVTRRARDGEIVERHGIDARWREAGREPGLVDVEAERCREVGVDGEIERRAAHRLIAAPQDVVAAVAGDDVIAGSADDEVVAETAGHRVVADAAVDVVVAGETEDQVVAVAGDDGVGSEVAVDGVVAFGAFDRIAAGVATGGGQPAEQEIVADAAADSVRTGAAADGVVAALAQHQVVAAARVDQVGIGFTLDRIVASTPGDGVGAIAAEHEVVAVAGADRIGASIAIDGIVAAAGRDGIVARGADDGIVAIARGDSVCAVVGEDHVVAVGDRDEIIAALAVDGVVVVPAGDRVAAFRAGRIARLVVAVDQVVAGTGVDVVGAAAAVDFVGIALAEDLVVALIAVDLVAAGAAVKHVDPGVAVDQVLAGLAPDGVVAVVAGELVVAAAAEDKIVAVAPEHGVGAVLGTDGVVAQAAVDAVVALAAPDAVVALVAVDRVVAALAACGVLDVDDVEVLTFARDGDHRAVAEDHVVACRTGVGVAAGGIEIATDQVRAAAAEDDIAARTADDNVAAVGERRVARQHQLVGGDLALVAEDEVVAALAVDVIGTAVAVDDVVLLAADDGVVALATLDDAASGAEDDEIVADAAVDLELHRGVGDLGQVDDVVALAAQGDDAGADLVFLRLALGYAKGLGPDLDLAGSGLFNVEVLGDVSGVALEPLVGELAHVELQHATGEFGRQRRDPRERNIEADERDLGRDVEFLVDLEQHQIDLQVREQLRVEPAGDVEHGQWRERRAAVVGLVQEVGRQLGQPNLAVVVRVVQVEVDLGEDAAADAGLGHHQVDFRGRGDAAGQRDFGHVDLARGVHVIDEEAVEQQFRAAEAAVGEFDQALRVVAEGEVDVRREPPFDRGPERPPDREERRVAELELERARIDPHQRDVGLAHQQTEDLSRVLQDRERKHVAEALVAQAAREAGGLGRARTGGVEPVERAVETEVRRRVDRIEGRAEIGQRIRQVSGHAAGFVEDLEAAERDDDVRDVGRNAVDQLYHADDVPDQADVELIRRGDLLRDVEQRDGLAGQVRDHRDRRGDDVDQRLQRLGDLLHLLDDRLDVVADEAAEVEADVVELDDLQAVLDRIADRVERDETAVGTVADAPLEQEVGDDLREHRACARHQITVQLQREREIDLGVRGNAGVDADVAEIGQADASVVAVLFLEIDGDGRAEPGVALVVGLDLQERELAGDAAAGHRHVDVHLQLVRARQVEIEALAAADAETEVQAPVDLDVDLAAGLEAETGDADVHVDAGAGIEQRAPQLQVPLHVDVARADPGIVDIGLELDVGDRHLAVAVAVAEDVQIVVQQTEHLHRDEVRRRVVRGLDDVAQAGDEVVAEAADEGRGVGQLVADQRHLEAADLAVEEVLDEAQEAVDAVDDQQHVVERAELREVEVQDRVGDVDELVGGRPRGTGHVDAVGQRRGEVAADADVAAEQRLGREIHRQRAADGDVHPDI